MLGIAVCMLFHFMALSWMNYIYSQIYGAPNTNGKTIEGGRLGQLQTLIILMIHKENKIN